MGPKLLYMHGFASGPESAKGVALGKHFAAQGVDLVRLDGRKPSFERLRLSAIIDELGRAIGGPEDRAVVFGSSLGGLAAARLAERDARVCALVLLAPGFRIADQLARALGDAGGETWKRTGWMQVQDHATKLPAKVDYGFYENAREVDSRNGGWPDVRVPTLLIHGTKDTSCDVGLSREWAKVRPHVRMVEVDDGHELTGSLPRIIDETERFLVPFLGR